MRVSASPAPREPVAPVTQEAPDTALPAPACQACGVRPAIAGLTPHGYGRAGWHGRRPRWHGRARGQKRARRRGPAARPADRGSVSLWVIIFTFTTLALLVLVVDGGEAINAKSRAADIAEQAARAAANDVNVAGLRAGTLGLGGGACDLRQGPAAELVADYASGVPGATATLTGCTPSMTTVGGTPSLSVTATVQLSVRPALPVPPFNTISATARETAFLACGSANQREAC